MPVNWMPTRTSRPDFSCGIGRSSKETERALLRMKDLFCWVLERLWGEVGETYVLPLWRRHSDVYVLAEDQMGI